MATGWQALGNVLGGGIDREGAYEEGRFMGARTEDALARARLNQTKALSEKQKVDANTGLAAAFVDMFGMSPEQAQGMATSVTAGSGNIQQQMQALQAQQELNARQGLLDNPDVGVGEIMRTRGALGDSFTPTNVEGGIAFNYMDADPMATAQVTPGEQANINQRNAAADLSRARIAWGPARTAADADADGIEAFLNRPLPPSTLPEDATLGEALGGGGFVRRTGNQLVGLASDASQLFGAGRINIPYQGAQEGINFLDNLNSRTLGIARTEFPGFRGQYLLEMIARGMGAEPAQISVGEQQAVSKFTQTRDHIARTIAEAEADLRNPAGMSNRSIDATRDVISQLRPLLADYNAVLERLAAEQAPAEEIPPAPPSIDPEAWVRMTPEERDRVQQILGGAQ